MREWFSRQLDDFVVRSGWNGALFMANLCVWAASLITLFLGLPAIGTIYGYVYVDTLAPMTVGSYSDGSLALPTNATCRVLGVRMSSTTYTFHGGYMGQVFLPPVLSQLEDQENETKLHEHAWDVDYWLQKRQKASTGGRNSDDEVVLGESNNWGWLKAEKHSGAFGSVEQPHAHKLDEDSFSEYLMPEVLVEVEHIRSD